MVLKRDSESLEARSTSVRGPWSYKMRPSTKARRLPLTESPFRLRSMEVSVGKGLHRIRGLLVNVEGGIVVIVMGGDTPHIGSIAVAIPTKCSGNSKISATVSVYTVSGHKDDAVAVPIARNISIATNKISTVVAGIHINCATKRDIRLVLVNSRRMTIRMERLIRNMSFRKPNEVRG